MILTRILLAFVDEAILSPCTFLRFAQNRLLTLTLCSNRVQVRAQFRACEQAQCRTHLKKIIMVIKGTLKWKEYPLNHPENIRLLGPAIVLVGDAVYIHGGFGSRQHPFYRVALTTRRWRRLPNLEYRYGHSNVLVNDKIYVFGGARSDRSNLPIEAYDLVTNTVEAFDRCEASRQLTAYVESRREVIITGIRTGQLGVQVFGFNVDTGSIASYRITGGEAPTSSYKAGLVLSGHRLYYLSKKLHGARIFVLTLGRRHEAAWSVLELRGPALPKTVHFVFQVVHGLLVQFGGRKLGQSTPEELYLVDPLNLETVHVRPLSQQTDIFYEGNWRNWPKPPIEAGSAAANGKLWIFGGRSNPKILELEVDRSL